MELKYIETIVSSGITIIGFSVISDIIFSRKIKYQIKDVLIILAYAVIIGIITANQELKVDGLSKVLIFYAMIIVFNKYKYERNMQDVIIGTFLVYLNFIITETVLQSLIYMFCVAIDKNLFVNMIYGYIISTIVTIISVSVVYTFRIKYQKIFNAIKSYNVAFLGITILIFITMAILAFKVPIIREISNAEFIVIYLLLFAFITIGFYIMKEKAKADRIMDEYKRLSEYAKGNEGMLEDYRMSCHENKNHLIIIANMIPKSNKKVHEYISSILKKQTMNRYYFINELKNIPITELKGFVNFKLMEMLNEKINLEINISKEISRSSKLKKLNTKEKEDLYNIIGVLIDNAYEASKESKEKEVVLQMYKEGSKVVIIIANTYKGEVDIEKVSEYGYSTKGKNHGTGLHIVEKIIDKSERMEKETSLMANYFVQTIKLK